MGNGKYKKYEFWFCGNKMYSCETIKRAQWWNKLAIMSGCLVFARCSVITNLGVDEARKIAKMEFEADGFYEQIMGTRL